MIRVFFCPSSVPFWGQVSGLSCCCRRSESVYFLLSNCCTFPSVCVTECVIDCLKFVSSHALGVTVMALSSYDPKVRAAAYHVLGCFYQHLEGARIREKRQVKCCFLILHRRKSPPGTLMGLLLFNSCCTWWIQWKMESGGPIKDFHSCWPFTSPKWLSRCSNQVCDLEVLSQTSDSMYNVSLFMQYIFNSHLWPRDHQPSPSCFFLMFQRTTCMWW